MKIQRIWVQAWFMVAFVCAAPSAAFAFGPCSSDFPDEVSYLPRLSQCGGNAAIVLTGELKNSFSVVVRACDNGDRDPCYKNLDACATNASSPFKVQKTIEAIVDRKGENLAARIHCLKEAGNSKVYRMVRRLTIKRVDPVRNPVTDVKKICLNSRTKVFNKVTVITTGKVTLAGNTGYNPNCLTQRYLGCNIEQAISRVCPMK